MLKSLTIVLEKRHCYVVYAYPETRLLAQERGLKNGPKPCQAKDCGGGVKGRRPVCFFFRAPFQYSPFFWDKEPGPWGGGGGYFLK